MSRRPGRPSAGGRAATSLAGHAAQALAEIVKDWPTFTLPALAGHHPEPDARLHAATGPAGAAGQPAAAPPADRKLADYFRANPALGQRDRRWVADRVFDVLRNARAQAAWLLANPAEDHGRPEAERLVNLSIRLDRGPSGPNDSRAGVEAGRDEALLAAFDAWSASLPPAVRYSLPDWLWARLGAAWPDRAESIAVALNRPAPVDLRCNLLRAKPTALRARLAADGVETDALAWEADADGPWSSLPSTALRVRGRPALERLAAYEEGWFEIQDAGSQRIADACDAKRGEVVVDFCAGAGGKTLALAARMRDVGRLFAFDTDGPRLARLTPRAERAGVSIITPMRIDGADDIRLGRYHGKADCVLVDAPCGGSGTVRRSPDLKWRYGPADIARFVQTQQQVLAAAARLVRPGGRLIYATCSLLADENIGSVRTFEDSWPMLGDGRSLKAVGSAHVLPDAGSDGFFVAKWVVNPR